MCHYQQLADKLPKAAKAHRCDVCHKTIPRGEVYSRVVGITEGYFQDDVMHIRCRALVNAAFDEQDEQCAYGGWKNWLAESASYVGWRTLRQKAREYIRRYEEKRND